MINDTLFMDLPEETNALTLGPQLIYPGSQITLNENKIEMEEWSKQVLCDKISQSIANEPASSIYLDGL